MSLSSPGLLLGRYRAVASWSPCCVDPGQMSPNGTPDSGLRSLPPASVEWSGLWMSTSPRSQELSWLTFRSVVSRARFSRSSPSCSPPFLRSPGYVRSVLGGVGFVLVSPTLPTPTNVDQYPETPGM